MKQRAQGLMAGLVLGLLVAGGAALASTVSLPFTFSANTTARASEVNANFGAVKTAVDDTQAQVTALAGRVGTLEGAGGAPRLTDATGKAVGPYFLYPSTYPSPAYLAPDKSLWRIDLSTGELLAATITDALLYTSPNCSGPAYYALGGSSSRTPPRGSAVELGSAGALHVLRGPEATVVPASYKSPSASGSCTAGVPYGAYGPYVLASDAPAVAKPATTWTAPLTIELP